MKQSNAMAYLRQLCCSGLGKEIVIPEFLRAVQAVIPSGCNTFSGCDKHFNPSYHLLEFVVTEIAELAPIVVANYLTPERRARSGDMYRQHPDVTLWDELYYLSDLFTRNHTLFEP